MWSDHSLEFDIRELVMLSRDEKSTACWMLQSDVDKGHSGHCVEIPEPGPLGGMSPSYVPIVQTSCCQCCTAHGDPSLPTSCMDFGAKL